MGYTPSFTPQYENGWENLPNETSPITAEAFNGYDDAIENIEDYLASDNSQANLADAYDETATYEAGDYVIYGGDLYKCLEDIDEPEEWDSTKWESCLITDEMATSGGTTVIANPTGTATATLNKLQVEETIYSVEGGGGGASAWTGTQAELEEVFDELEDGTLVNITDDEQEVVEGGTIYSEDEQVIGLWTDNKPLYQKTVIIPTVTVNTTIDIVTAGTISFDEIVSVSGFYDVAWSGGGSVNELNTYVNANNYSYARTRDTNAVQFYSKFESGMSLSNLKATITYTKSTDAPLDAVVGKKTMYIASSDCYSTEEKEIGCWQDGKPLYQRSFIYNNTSGISATTNLAEISIDFVVHDIECAVINSQDGRSYPLPYFNGNKTTALVTYTENSKQYIRVVINNDSWSNLYTPWIITIRYTKTTDTAGSGKFTPASGQAVHYSTEEQVIGTWIDGSTLYRKVLSIPITNKNTDYDISSLNVGLMLNIYGASATKHLPFNAIHNTGALSYSVGVNSTNNAIQIRFGESVSIETPVYLVCEYTKATS